MAIQRLTFKDKADGLYFYPTECNTIRDTVNLLVDAHNALNPSMQIPRLRFPDKHDEEYFFPGEFNLLRDTINLLIDAQNLLTDTAAAPGTVTYTASATYTARCGTDKEGTGSSVSRTATAISTSNQADADAKALANAKTAAVGALVCTVEASTPPPASYTGAYTARCGTDKSGTGSDVTRTATASTQAEADTAAKNAAIAALVCQVSSPVYNTRLDANNLEGDGIYFDATSSEVMLLNVRVTSGLPLVLRIVSNDHTTNINFASDYAGDGFSFFNTAGTRFEGVFPATDDQLLRF